jgi:hypothetical protein
MMAFVGFVMAAQVTGLGPLAALRQHLSDPISASPLAALAAHDQADNVPTCSTAGPHKLYIALLGLVAVAAFECMLCKTRLLLQQASRHSEPSIYRVATAGATAGSSV